MNRGVNRGVAILAVATSLFGCAHHPLDCATGLIAWDDCEPGTKGYEMRQAAANRDDQDCQSWGAKPGTETYVNCRAMLAQANAQRRAAVAAALIATMPKPQPVQPHVMPTSPTVNCTSVQTGTITNTNCH
jgi:hypothetical protein